MTSSLRNPVPWVELDRGAVIVTLDTYDPERLDAHVTSMLRRLGTSRKEYVQRMRFARAAEILLKLRGAVYAMADAISGITPSGALRCAVAPSHRGYLPCRR